MGKKYKHWDSACRIAKLLDLGRDWTGRRGRKGRKERGRKVEGQRKGETEGQKDRGGDSRIPAQAIRVVISDTIHPFLFETGMQVSHLARTASQ